MINPIIWLKYLFPTTPKSWENSNRPFQNDMLTTFSFKKAVETKDFRKFRPKWYFDYKKILTAWWGYFWIKNTLKVVRRMRCTVSTAAREVQALSRAAAGIACHRRRTVPRPRVRGESASFEKMALGLSYNTLWVLFVTKESIGFQDSWTLICDLKTQRYCIFIGMQILSKTQASEPFFS